MDSSAQHRRILLIDCYDSFTNNVSALLSRCTGATVHTIHNDAPYATIAELEPFLSCFDAVVVGPGPGSPDVAADVGIVKDLWRLPEDRLLPIFGVCLGLQSLCLEFGAQIRRLHTVKHGLPSDIEHDDEDIFHNAGGITAVRYHSLYAELPADQSDLRPLAWAEDVENGRVLMGARHARKPFWAVQYHPESICTSGGGDRVIANFWQKAQEWNAARKRRTVPLPSTWSTPPREPSLLDQHEQWRDENGLVTTPPTKPRTVETRTLHAHGVSAPRMCELLGVETAQDFVLLDSAASPGRYSIIGVVTAGLTQLISYTAGDAHATLSVASKTVREVQVPLDAYAGSIHRYLASFMAAHRAESGPAESPFWGGLVGYFSYELGVSSLSIPLPAERKRRADVNLAFVERSIVLDTQTGRVYIQSLRSDDSHWLDATRVLLQREANLPPTPSTTPPPPPAHVTEKARIHFPERTHYEALVSRAQEYLAAGESYELCLTGRTRITLPSPQPSPWSLYSRLRVRNAAPYAAYVRLQGVTLLSSSPERFVSYSRAGHVQLRPIKGTVKKAPGTTFESASAVLNTPKERAENLMIVDLIRHDLSRAMADVRVSKLMAVEEYRTVYQLVSVIEGDLPARYSGFDVLAASLPPGSMTGAPKKRSVEILQALEAGAGMGERGVYSGVVGYWCAGGGGDWSVVIRSAVRDEDAAAGEWCVGAGGAVTALSSPEGEWEEMKVKAESTVAAFLGV